MKILLTGGSGFIGHNLRESLAGRHHVTAPPHTELDVTDADAVESFIRSGRFDAIIHAAIEGGPSVLETTLRGMWNMLRNAEHTGRIVYFGSGAEFGKHRDLVRVREEEIGREVPRDPYGFAKFLGNDLARRHRRAVNLRLFGVYGPREGYLFKFISNSIAKALLGIDIVIRQDVTFDYLWVGDLARIVERILATPPPEADYNVTPDTSVTLTTIAQMVRQHVGGTAGVRVDLPRMNFEYTGSNDRLRRFLPDFRFTSLSDGIVQLTDFYADRIDTLDREKLLHDEYARQVSVRRAGHAAGSS